MAARRMCSAPAAGCRCANIRENEAVDFAIVGTGAGGGTLACKLAEARLLGRRRSMPARICGRSRISPPTRREQTKLYWTDERIVDGDNPLQLGSNNSGKAVGGSTVHFAMVSLRFRPEWFKSRSLLGYGADWPLDWREMWRYYAEVEQALKIAGPVSYPWGPQRPRYPYRAHELNAAALRARARLRGAGHRLDARRRSPRCPRRAAWRILASIAASASPAARPTPSKARWSPGSRARSPPARKSATSRWSGGSRWTKPAARPACTTHREGAWRFQRARNVVVAGYAIETPRLLLNSATARFPDGLANSSGLVGKNLMVQSNQAVWGVMEEEVRWYKGPPSLAITEHWNYEDKGKDFFGGYCYMSQGPLPQLGPARSRARAGCGASALIDEMEKYNPSGRSEDRRRDAAAGAQPRHAGRREGPVRSADPAHHLFLVRQRQAR